MPLAIAPWNDPSKTLRVWWRSVTMTYHDECCELLKREHSSAGTWLIVVWPDLSQFFHEASAFTPGIKRLCTVSTFLLGNVFPCISATVASDFIAAFWNVHRFHPWKPRSVALRVFCRAVIFGRVSRVRSVAHSFFPLVCQALTKSNPIQCKWANKTNLKPRKETQRN